MVCMRCRYFSLKIPANSKIDNPIGYCSKYDIQPHSEETCRGFLYDDKYITTPAKPDISGKYLCHRCKRPLTDSDSIARGLGAHCYKVHLREIMKLNKRLF